MTGTNVGDRLTWGAEILRKVGVESPRSDARLLLSHAMGYSVEWILAHPEAHITAVLPYEEYIAR